MGACLATPCSVRSSWFANSQAAEIERLTKENNVHVKRREYSTEYANVQANEALLYQKTISDLRKENEALKAALNDAARSLNTISRLAGNEFYVGEEGERVETYMKHLDQIHGYASSRYGAAIDAMKGAT